MHTDEEPHRYTGARDGAQDSTRFAISHVITNWERHAWKTQKKHNCLNCPALCGATTGGVSQIAFDGHALPAGVYVCRAAGIKINASKVIFIEK